MSHFVIGLSNCPAWSRPYSPNDQSTSAIRLYVLEVDREYFEDMSSNNDIFSDDFNGSYLCLGTGPGTGKH